MNFLTLASECDTKNNAVSFLQTRGILHNPRLCKNKHEMVLLLTEKQDVGVVQNVSVDNSRHCVRIIFWLVLVSTTKQ